METWSGFSSPKIEQNKRIVKGAYNKVFITVTNTFIVLQRKPFTFELFFCWANADFFTFSSKTRSIVLTSKLQRKPFTFELFFCWANAGFFTFSSKTRSIVLTSKLQRKPLEFGEPFYRTIIVHIL